MGNLSFFLAENVEKKQNLKVAISKRFKDEKGNPVEWEVRSISAVEDEALRKACTRRVQIPGKKNAFMNDFDANTYIAKLTASAVVYPDLNDAALQNSYCVMGAEQLLRTMLYKEEFDKLSEIVTGTSEAEDVNDLVDEAKN